ncbi:MAG: serine/threonine protein kinase [Acidobacteriota bacterium]
MNESQIKESIQCYVGLRPSAKLNIVTDTTEFMRVQAGDVLELAGKYYLVRGDEVEGRFGLDGDPKYWVKKAVDLSDGSAKIIKLVFYESFFMQLGEQRIKCYRSPLKEARVLEKVRFDPFFMQGFNVEDSAGNSVRIIDRVQGTRFYDLINKLDMDHETYFREVLPTIFPEILRSVEAIGRLHALDDVHGDIRNDHILIERDTGIYTWIDFDYSYDWAENRFGIDLFGLGNVLLFTIGKGFHHIKDINSCAPPGMRVRECVNADDLSLSFKYRVSNLRKLFPYIPESLNHVLMHFSCGTQVFYEHTEELLEDLRLGMRDLGL